HAARGSGILARDRRQWPSVGFLQELGELVDAALVAPAGECGVDESGDAGLGHVAADKASTERKHIGVIMFTGKLGRYRVVDTSTPAFRLAIDGNRDTNPRSADSHAALGISRR